MAVEREAFLQLLEHSFSAYYDIDHSAHPELPLVFRGDYQKRDERYWLTKSIPIWASETGEYAYVFAGESFSPELAKACIDYALADGLPRVRPHKEHQHTDIKVLLIADSVDPSTRKFVQKAYFTKSYHHSFWGFSNLLAAVVDLQEEKAFPNKAGYALDHYFRKLFVARKEEG